MKIKRALISVSNKIDVVEFARKLSKCGVEIISTGGTGKAIRAAGIPVTYVSELTGFPEIMNGRVKMLNPNVSETMIDMTCDKVQWSATVAPPRLYSFCISLKDAMATSLNARRAIKQILYMLSPLPQNREKAPSKYCLKQRNK